ncbi:MAG TPA: histidine phosphatase family protein [Candidatus Baltobacteraceae bacterium]|jgi:broad specificity phosphatase PhoE
MSHIFREARYLATFPAASHAAWAISYAGTATIVIVGHEAINRVVLLYALGLPLSHYWRFRQGPCCINELDFEPDKCIVCSINDMSHVPVRA